MDYIILSFYGTGILLPIIIVSHLLLKLMASGNSQVLLCMECDQCMNACPSLNKNKNAASPKDIMVGAKEGNLTNLYNSGVIFCNSCGACEKKCPRGLAPYKEVERLTPCLTIPNKIPLTIPNKSM